MNGLLAHGEHMRRIRARREVAWLTAENTTVCPGGWHGRRLPRSGDLGAGLRKVSTVSRSDAPIAIFASFVDSQTDDPRGDPRHLSLRNRLRTACKSASNHEGLRPRSSR